MTMRLYQALMVTVVAFFCCDTLSAGAVDGQTKTGALSIGVNHPTNSLRSLRVDKTTDADEDDNSNEARAFGKKILFQELFGSASRKHSKVLRWAAADKSDDYVKKELKLKGLSGDDLVTHKNYEYFKQFLTIRESDRLSAWLKKEIPPADVWKTLGLGNVRTLDEAIDAEPSEAFRIFTRYARNYDDRVILNNVNHKTPIPVISNEASYAEKVARMAVWVKAGRNADYAKKVLGVDKLSPTQLAKSENNRIFLDFLEITRMDSHTGMEKIIKKSLNLDELSPQKLVKSKGYPFYKWFIKELKAQ